jgi:phosphopantothenoylcysteine synthetase/decarboxylase
VCSSSGFRPKFPKKKKLRKNGSELLLRLEPTEDILLEVAKKRNEYTKLNALSDLPPKAKT